MVRFTMIIMSFVALIVVGTVHGDIEVITEAIHSMLSLKGTAYPYSAEYELALPPQTRIAGRTEKRRFFAERPDHLYSEQTDDCQRLRTLICDKKLLFEYFDNTSGRALGVGPVDLGGRPPDRWLEDHHFIFNSYSPLDADLIKVVRELLAASKVTRHHEAGVTHTYHLSGSRLGDLVIILGSQSAEINVVVPGAAPAKLKTVFRYIYHDGRSPWSAAAIAELKADFEKAGAQEVHRFTGEFTMFTALKQAFPGSGEIRVISPAESKRLAVHHGYMLPTAPEAKVIETRDFNGQLHLKVKFNGKIYSIGQYPAVSRVRDDESLAFGVKGRRKLGDYTVLDIRNPGLEANWIYYLKNGVALIVQDPQYKPIPFMDHNLDRLIKSFSPVREEKEEGGKSLP
jgi:hypothetical protein